jgi:glycosyltransferase involved in cell wall biosynthesis
MTVVTILMPVYNVELFVAESIRSILNQSFSDFEFIIINDGSTDKTPEIVSSFNDPRILFINNAINKKKIACLNEGLRIAKGEFLALMDGDDIADITRIEKLFNFLLVNEEIGVCGSWFESFGDYSKTHKFPLTHDEIYFGLFSGCPITVPLIRKTILDKNNIYFNPDFFSEDSYLWIQLAEITRFANIPEVLYKYRVHSTQVTQKFDKLLNDSVIREKNVHFNNLIRKLTGTENERNIQFQPTSKVHLSDLKNYEELSVWLFRENKKKKIFSQKLLQATLSQQFFNQLKNQIRYNLHSMVYFYLSPLLKHAQISLGQHIKLILKSLIHKRIELG